MANLFWRMLSLFVTYPIAFPALLGYRISKNQRFLDILYKIRSLTHGIPVGNGLRLSKQKGYQLLFPSREDPNFEDVFFRNVYFPYKPQSEDIIFDIGAHMGFFTIKNANKVQRVFAFEPDLRNYGFLLKNIKLNKMANVIAYHYAVGETNGSIFLKPSYGQGRTSVTATDTGIKVDVRSIDSMANTINSSPSVIKIDTEGFEIPILKGAKKVLRKNKPKLLVASYHYPTEALEVVQYLSTKGYRCYKYDVPYTLQKAKETYIYAEPL